MFITDKADVQENLCHEICSGDQEIRSLGGDTVADTVDKCKSRNKIVSNDDKAVY